MSGKKIGVVTHFYDRISVAVIKLSGDVQLGDQVRFQGRETDFEQNVLSMQIEHQPIQAGLAGQEIAMQVIRPVRRRDVVFKLPSAS